MNYEKELRKYINEIRGNPVYRKNYLEWAFGAVNFAYNAGLIDSTVSDVLNNEYGLLE